MVTIVLSNQITSKQLPSLKYFIASLIIWIYKLFINSFSYEYRYLRLMFFDNMLLFHIFFQIIHSLASMLTPQYTAWPFPCIRPPMLGTTNYSSTLEMHTIPTMDTSQHHLPECIYLLGQALLLLEKYLMQKYCSMEKGKDWAIATI